jgi:perosamine synthetase
MTVRIPVSQPLLGEAESRCVGDALAKGAISGFFGEYIGTFEQEFARYCDCEHGVATTSGTTALHLGLAALGVGPGDDVLVSTFTNMATIFAILYVGARPIPIDIETDTLNLDPALLEAKRTPQTRAVLVVHLFGHPVDMVAVTGFAKRHGLLVIEDCAQAHGATCNGRKVGSFGDAGCFSFYANKIITTGEGGMVVFRDARHAARARDLRGLAFGATNKFMHQAVGYNYRMTNLQAALGHAQFSKIEDIIARKRAIAAEYTARLQGTSGLQLPVEKPYARNVYWMYHVVLTGAHGGRRDAVMKRLADAGIETRETFIPCNLQDIFLDKGLVARDACPNANDVAYKGFYLPSGPELSREEIDYVAHTLTAILRSPDR